MRDPHGRSPGTRFKEAFFGECLGYHISQMKKVLDPKRRYYNHIDCNAGPGRNEDLPSTNGRGINGNTVAGTPELILTRVNKYATMAFNVILIEKNRHLVDTLRTTVGQWRLTDDLYRLPNRVQIEHGNNEHLLPKHVSGILAEDGDPVGSLVSDPNGWTPSRQGGSVSLEVLRAAAAALPRFMLLIYFPAGLARKNAGWKLKNPDKHMTVRRVEDFLPLRREWIINATATKPIAVALCGTPYPLRPWRSGGYTIRSSAGQELLRRCAMREEVC